MRLPLPDLPDDWSFQKLRRVVQPSRRITYGIVQAGPHIEGGVPYIRPVDMTDEGGTSLEQLRRTTAAIAAAYRRSEVTTGDLVVTIGPSYGKVMTVPPSLDGANLTQGTARVAVNPAGADSRFIFWCLRSGLVSGQWDASVGGATFRALNLGPLGETSIPIGPVEAQTRIADFLDRKTAAIDALIAKKERLIELLEEKRQALITQAVTKGLDPNVPMKDSGIEWLGEIPAHWHVEQLRRVVSRFIDYRGRTPTKTDDGVPLITAGAARAGRIDHQRSPEFIDSRDYAEWMRRGLPEVDDLVLTTEAPLGEVGLVEDTHVAFAQRVILMKLDTRIMLPGFLRLYYLSEAGKSELVSRASGSTASGIRADRLRDSKVLVAPLGEQDAIAAQVAPALAARAPNR